MTGTNNNDNKRKNKNKNKNIENLDKNNDTVQLRILDHEARLHC